jgi:large subunit ribosomal protein L25
MALAVREKDFEALLKAKGHSASLVNVRVDGSTALLSAIADIQRDPVTDKFLHVDFHEVSQTERMVTTVPLEFVGEPAGVRNGSGILDIARHEIGVRCLPADLPSSLSIDVGPLEVGAIVHFSDVVVPPGVELIGDPSTPVVACKAVAEESNQGAAAAVVQGAAKETKADETAESAGEDATKSAAKAG